MQKLAKLINPELGDDVQSARIFWEQVLGGKYADGENGGFILGFVQWLCSDELEAMIQRNVVLAGETWAREKASRDELNRLSLLGEFFRDLDSSDWEDRLAGFFAATWFGPDIPIAAVRMINPSHGTDDASANAYWRQIAGEWLVHSPTVELVVAFLRAAISVAWERNMMTWESLQTGDPGPCRAPRKVGSARNIRPTDPDATDDE